MQKISKRLGVAMGNGRAALLGIVLSALSAVSHADGVPPYTELLQNSLSNAPLLLEQAANVRAASADARQARAWLNPSLSALYENLNAPKSGGVDQRQDTYSITQPFEIGGKRAARIEVGDRSLAAAEARSRQAQLAFSANLAVAYSTAEAMQIRKDLAKEELARANEDLRVARAQTKAGREAELRVVQATASVSAAQANEQAATADATEALERLSALVGVDKPYTSIGRTFLDSASGITRLGGSNQESPSVVTAAAEREAYAAQVRVEEKRWIPDIGLNVGTRKYAWSNESGTVVGVTASIPLFDQNRGAIDAARERAAAAEARLEAARLDAAAARRSAAAQVIASEKRLEAALQGETAAAEAYRLARIGYDAGKNPLLELLVIRRALTEAKLATVDARLARIRALATLSMADGRIAFGESE